MNDTPNDPQGVDPTRPSPARLHDYYLERPGFPAHGESAPGPSGGLR